ncbi:hypothetical protein HYX09_05515, partial [Candidatus Woesearchaeota archaeon]|nr:hypothetical protein [Candidatus Woesearchaeota archaeon]
MSPQRLSFYKMEGSITIRKLGKAESGRIATFLRKNLAPHNLKFSRKYVDDSMKSGVWIGAVGGSII